MKKAYFKSGSFLRDLLNVEIYAFVSFFFFDETPGEF